jgi:hypothetical protein
VKKFKQARENGDLIRVFPGKGAYKHLRPPLRGPAKQWGRH